MSTISKSEGGRSRKRSVESTGSKKVETSKVVEITKRHHHRHHKHGENGGVTTVTKETKVIEHSKEETEMKKWHSTFDLVTKLLAKVADVEYDEPKTDKEMRSLIVDITEKVCAKAKNSVDMKEYKAMQMKYEHQLRKTKRMQKRAERILKEVEINRERLDQHLRKVKQGEITETDKILKGIDALMVQQAENHKLFLQAETPSPVKKSRIKTQSIHVRSFQSSKHNNNVSTEISASSELTESSDSD